MVEYAKKGNRGLDELGIKSPLNRAEMVRMGEFKEAVDADVIKFEKEGDAIEGEFRGYEESKQYAKSYAIKINTAAGLKVVFASGILIDKLETNSVKSGQQIRITFLGKKKAEKSGREYNDYKLEYK